METLKPINLASTNPTAGLLHRAINALHIPGQAVDEQTPTPEYPRTGRTDAVARPPAPVYSALTHPSSAPELAQTKRSRGRRDLFHGAAAAGKRNPRSTRT